MSNLFKHLLMNPSSGAGTKSNPDPEDFGLLSSDALRYAGWEPHYLGAYSKDTDIITDLIAEWFEVTPIVGSYGGRT